MSAPNLNEIEWAISVLEKEESSFSIYSKLADLYICRNEMAKQSDSDMSYLAYSGAADPDMREDQYPQEEGRKTEKSPTAMTEQLAEEWVKHMENADGTKGAHWSVEIIKKLMEQKKELQEFELADVFAVINMMYSDYVEVAKKLNINAMDFYVLMTAAWLKDKDTASGKEKTLDYYRYIVR
jgi:hypothetical protein